MPAINPDSTVLQQVDGHWQKLCALILWKTVGAGKVVSVTSADMQAMTDHFAPGNANVFTHGKPDGLEFSLVTDADGIRIAAHDRAMRSEAAQ